LPYSTKLLYFSFLFDKTSEKTVLIRQNFSIFIPYSTKLQKKQFLFDNIPMVYD